MRTKPPDFWVVLPAVVGVLGAGVVIAAPGEKAIGWALIALAVVLFLTYVAWYARWKFGQWRDRHQVPGSQTERLIPFVGPTEPKAAKEGDIWIRTPDTPAKKPVPDAADPLADKPPVLRSAPRLPLGTLDLALRADSDAAEVVVRNLGPTATFCAHLTGIDGDDPAGLPWRIAWSDTTEGERRIPYGGSGTLVIVRYDYEAAAGLYRHRRPAFIYRLPDNQERGRYGLPHRTDDDAIYQHRMNLNIEIERVDTRARQEYRIVMGLGLLEWPDGMAPDRRDRAADVVRSFIALRDEGAAVIAGLTLPRPYPEGLVAAGLEACEAWIARCRLAIYDHRPDCIPAFRDAQDPHHGPLHGALSDIDAELREGQLVGEYRRAAQKVCVILDRIVSRQDCSESSDAAISSQDQM